MAEYIEREKLIKDLKNNADYKSECGFKQDIDIESLISYLKKLPSANVVKVVRCKDCKHLIKEKMICTHIRNRIFNTGFTTFSNHYCSYGQLKELGK